MGEIFAERHTAISLLLNGGADPFAVLTMGGAFGRAADNADLCVCAGGGTKEGGGGAGPDWYGGGRRDGHHSSSGTPS